MTLQFSKAELKTFLLIYAANADYEFNEREIKFIKERTSLETFKKMFDLFQKSSEYQALKVIISHKEAYFKNDEQKKEMYDELTDLFKIDGEYSRGEKVFLNFLDKMMSS